MHDTNHRVRGDQQPSWNTRRTKSGEDDNDHCVPIASNIGYRISDIEHRVRCDTDEQKKKTIRLSIVDTSKLSFQNGDVREWRANYVRQVRYTESSIFRDTETFGIIGTTTAVARDREGGGCLLPAVGPVKRPGLARLELHADVTAVLADDQHAVASVHDRVPAR